MYVPCFFEIRYIVKPVEIQAKIRCMFLKARSNICVTFVENQYDLG